jgi:hypothetical protein
MCISHAEHLTGGKKVKQDNYKQSDLDFVPAGFGETILMNEEKHEYEQEFLLVDPNETTVRPSRQRQQGGGASSSQKKESSIPK